LAANSPIYSELSGKVAVISGASGNLGLAVIRRLHAEAVRLALIDRNPDKLKETLHGDGIEPALVGPADLTVKSQVDAFVDNVVSTFGQVDILVHTAGGYKNGAPVYEMDESLWDFFLNLNAKTTFLLDAAVARTMVKKGNKGRIINVSGRAGLSAFATGSAYSVSKSAVLRITEALAGELLSQGVTVNAILPSTIDTPQNRASDPNADFSKWVAPESIADVIAFLCSDAARDISGAAIPVYGRS
jgi:NAD(P)-dependent dehydrogenase (short-subunit alcohol dehydrogenase family)